MAEADEITRETIEAIRRIHRDFERMDWPATVRLGHGRSATEALERWFAELILRASRMTNAQLEALHQEDLEHHLRDFERAKSLVRID